MIEKTYHPQAQDHSAKIEQRETDLLSCYHSELAESILCLEDVEDSDAFKLTELVVAHYELMPQVIKDQLEKLAKQKATADVMQ